MPLDEAMQRLIADLIAGRVTLEEAKKRTKPARTREELEIEAELRDAEERGERFRQRIVDDILHSDPMFAGATFEQEAYERDLEIVAKAEKRFRRR